MGQIPSIELSEYDNTPNEGTDINVTATITSKSPLLSLKWVVIGGTGVNLPSSATTTNYSTVIGIVGVTHSILSLHSLSRNDSGNYSIVATNECGTQIASVNIKVEEGIFIYSYSLWLYCVANIYSYYAYIKPDPYIHIYLYLYLQLHLSVQQLRIHHLEQLLNHHQLILLQFRESLFRYHA